MPWRRWPAANPDMNASAATYRALASGLLRAGWASLTRKVRGGGPLFFEQLQTACVGAVGVVAVISLAAGFVFCMVVQGELGKLGMDAMIPNLLWMVFSEQLAPVLVSLVIIGRSISAMTAEVASMKNSEEIKALHITGIDVSGYLLLPRFLALSVAAPILTLLADFLGLAGGFLICGPTLRIDAQQFMQSCLVGAGAMGICIGAFKAVVFNMAAALIAFRSGLTCSEGSEGVSKSTTDAVVRTVVTIILLNVVLTGIHYVT
jgi:phospholipid/cholesterol/gamma-HCH transport system permease protein